MRPGGLTLLSNPVAKLNKTSGQLYPLLIALASWKPVSDFCLTLCWHLSGCSCYGLLGYNERANFFPSAPTRLLDHKAMEKALSIRALLAHEFHLAKPQ